MCTHFKGTAFHVGETFQTFGDNQPLAVIDNSDDIGHEKLFKMNVTRKQHAKFSEKGLFFIPWYARARGKMHIHILENLMCLVFL